MTIAVLFPSSANSCPSSEFALQCMLHYSNNQSHTFVCITDGKDITFKSSNNIKNVKTFFTLRNKRSRFFLTRFELNRIIKKNNIDILIHSGNISLRFASVRQVVCLNQVDTLQKNQLKQLHLHAGQIWVHNNYDDEILKKHLPEKRVSVIPFGASKDIKPFSWTEREACKKKLTGGDEYFLLHAKKISAQALMMVLKAFSAFKKWNRTSMKLLLHVSDKSKKTAIDIIKNYLYANDLLLIVENANEAEIEMLGSAYAVVFLSESEYPTGKMMHALSMEVPLLLPQHPYLESMFEASAGFYKNDIDGLFSKLSLLYKDEVYKNQLVTNGASKVAASSWKSVAQTFITAISNAV